jgi:hypothetical protein
VRSSRRRPPRRAATVLAATVAVVCALGAVVVVLLPRPGGSAPLSVGRVVPPRALRAMRPVGPGALLEPVGIVVDAGRLYVADARRGDIVVLSTDGEYLRAFGADRLEVPLYLAVGPRDGLLYITDRTLGAVLMFRVDGSFVGTFTPDAADDRGAAATASWQPLGIAFGGDDTMYVSDAAGSLLAFDSSGRLAAESGDDIPAGPAGRVSFANGIAAVGDSVIVADANNGRLLVLGRGLAFRRAVSFGGLPRGVAAPYGPGTLAVVVVDTAGCVLRVVDATGQFLASAGSKGSGSGSLLRPTGVGADGSGTLYVVDAGNARVSVWDPGSVERVDVFLDLASDPRTWGATVLLAIGAGLAIWTIRASRNAPPAV